MSYESKSIKDIIKDIEFEKAYLPAIQRKFVWPRRKIKHLFDSLMRNYPIGSFLFWMLKSDNAKRYVFYSFLKDYDVRSPYNLRKKGEFLHPEIIGVLDGQQRLSSLYLGLQGTHKQKLKYHRANSEHAYPETMLYLNLLSLPYYLAQKGDSKIIEFETDKRFEFRFLTKGEAAQTTRFNQQRQPEHVLWFKVGKVLSWPEDAELDEEFDKLIRDKEDEELRAAITENKRFILKSFRDLHKRITSQRLINYYRVSYSELDDILEIFVRVNSGGTILSKTDLLFSTIVATWEDGRDEIEAFLKELNEMGDGFRFNNDFLMRACLVLSDLPVLFKVHSFKTENVELIKSNWLKAKAALRKTVDLIASFGFNGSLLTSQNAVIVIAYHFMKGGSKKDTSNKAIRSYLLHALLKNVYGGQGDQVIRSFRNALREVSIEEKNKTYSLKKSEFPFNELLELKLPANKTLKITFEDIEEFVTYKKGANSFFVLSLLYPHLRYNQVHFHQDHIHPDSGFSKTNLKAIGFSEDKWESLWKIKDTLPNLQLLEGRQNQSKNAKPIKQWVSGNDRSGKKNVPDLQKFKEDNFIPKDVGLGFEFFEDFYQKRKTIIVNHLTRMFNITEIPANQT